MEEIVKFNHELLLDLDVTQNLNQFFFLTKIDVILKNVWFILVNYIFLLFFYPPS